MNAARQYHRDELDKTQTSTANYIGRARADVTIGAPTAAAAWLRLAAQQLEEEARILTTDAAQIIGTPATARA